MFASLPPRFWLATVLLILLGWEVNLATSITLGRSEHDYLSLNWVAPLITLWIGLSFGRRVYLALLITAPFILLGYAAYAVRDADITLLRVGLSAWAAGYPTLQSTAMLAAAVMAAEFRPAAAAQTIRSSWLAGLTFVALLAGLVIQQDHQDFTSDLDQRFDFTLSFAAMPLCLGMAVIASGLATLREGLWAAAIAIGLTLTVAAGQTVLNAADIDFSMRRFEWRVEDDPLLALVRLEFSVGSALALLAGVIAGAAIRPVLGWLAGHAPTGSDARLGLAALALIIAVPGGQALTIGGGQLDDTLFEMLEEVFLPEPSPALPASPQPAQDSEAADQEGAPERIEITGTRVRADHLWSGVPLLLVLAFALSAAKPRRAAFPVILLFLAVFALTDVSAHTIKELTSGIYYPRLPDELLNFIQERIAGYAMLTLLLWSYAFAGAAFALRGPRPQDEMKPAA